MPIDCHRNSHTLVSSQKVISVGINAAKPRRKKRRKSWVKLSRVRAEPAVAPERGADEMPAATGAVGVVPPVWSGLGSLTFTTTSIHARKAKINPAESTLRKHPAARC